ncbi:MAG: hypothetical protein HKM95_08950 [Inquilinus sp.]|nr:hypothetical protein [Inquilinus sp.]
MRRRLTEWAAPLLALALAAVAVAAGQDAAAQYLSGGAPPPAVEPSFLQRVVGTVARWQAEMNAALTEQIQAVKTGDSLAAAFAIIGAGFVYGVLHAAGPGHGKVVVATYFLTHRARWRRGIAAGFAVALVQAATAIALVVLLAMALGVALTRVLDRAIGFELLSYGLIAALGLYMIARIATGRSSCGHDHDHDHDHPHLPADDADRGFGGGARRWIDRLLPNDLAPLAIAVGLRPCSGAIIVLLFTLANGIFLIGVLSTVSMALGTALTVSAAGLAAIAVRRTATAGARGQAVAARLRTSIGLAGALLITVLGGLMFAGALQRGGILGL